VTEAGGRRRGRGPRLLYWFRTPPGVRVGRTPIDDEAMRLLERQHPDLAFDWPRLLKESGAESMRREREPRERDRDRDRRERREPRPARPRPAETSAAAAPPMADSDDVQALAEAAELRAAEHADAVAADVETMADGAAAAVESEPPPDRLYVQAEQSERAEAEDDERRPGVDPPAALARLGAEGLARLRARYLDILSRIAERTTDEEERARLSATAERLNPDGWRNADEVAAALEQYESVFESLRTVVGRRPPRRG